MPHELNDQQLLRYSRHILLPKLDVAGQIRLKESSVLIIGLGGLGSAAAIYLATSGVGRLTLADDDKVDLSNLQRQILYRTADVGRAKTEASCDYIRQLNPEISLQPLAERLTDKTMDDTVSAVDLVVDATDNFQSRFAINRACVQQGKPMVSAAAIRFEGQISVFDTRLLGSPCYRCLYDDSYADERDTCEQSGVIAPLLGVLGSMQALEAIKLLIPIGRSLTGRLLLLDALTLEWQEMTLPRDPHCPVCGHRQPAAGSAAAE